MNNHDLGRSSTLCLVLGGGLTVLLAALTPWAVRDSMEAFTLVCVFFGVVALPLIIIGIKMKLKSKQRYDTKRVSFAETASGGMQRYKVEWLWDSACEVYCRTNNKDPQMLDDDDNYEIYDLAGNDAALLLTWVIEHDYFNPEDDDVAKCCEEVKRRAMTGSEFLDSVCDQKLSRSDFKDEIIGFIDDYFYDDGAHRCGDFQKDYESFVTGYLRKELFTVKFSWEEYNSFRPYIDKAYGMFLNEKEI